jgi:hypothetical protein
MEYKLNKEYFVSNDSDQVVFGKNTVLVDFSSSLSQKVLGKLYNLDKPYVSLVNECESDSCEAVEAQDCKSESCESVDTKKKVVKKYTSKLKTKKKVKIDEPKKSGQQIEDTNSNEEES